MGRRCSIIPQWFARQIASDRRYATRIPIRDLQHRLVVAPPRVYGDQRLFVRDLTIVPQVANSWHDDNFGNRIATLEAERIELAIEFNYEATIERIAGNAPHVAARWLEDARYRDPSSVTFPSTAMRNVARASTWRLPGSRFMAAYRRGRDSRLGRTPRITNRSDERHRLGVRSYTRAAHQSRSRLHRNETRFRRRDPNVGALHRSVRRRVYDIAFHRPYLERIRGLTRVGHASGATRENRVRRFRLLEMIGLADPPAIISAGFARLSLRDPSRARGPERASLRVDRSQSSALRDRRHLRAA